MGSHRWCGRVPPPGIDHPTDSRRGHLVRLVNGSGARSIADELAGFDLELADWVATQIERAFGGDLRYTLLRLRTNDRSAAAQALTDDEIAATVIFADALHERIRE